MDELSTIKRLIIQGRYAFTEKALTEMDRDHLTEELVVESILNAQFMKVKRSTSPYRKHKGERVCIIESFTYAGLLLYTKGVVRKESDGNKFYLLISSKRAL